MTKPKPSDIPQAIRDRAAAQMQDTLYENIYARLIDAYGRKPMRWIFAVIGVIGVAGSLLYSVTHGYTVYDWPIPLQYSMGFHSPQVHLFSILEKRSHIFPIKSSNE